MEASELRVNCLVQHDGYGIVKVHGVNLETKEILPSFEVEGQGDWWSIENFEPISLTPEILEQCGLEREICDHLHPDFFKKDLLLVENNNNGYDLYFCSNFVRSIEYLHQLQNFYFAFSNEELTVNLNEPQPA